MISEAIVTAFPAIPAKVIEPIAMPVVMPVLTMMGVSSPIGAMVASSLLIYGATKVTIKLAKKSAKLIQNRIKTV